MDDMDELTMQRGHAVYLDNCQGSRRGDGVGLDRVFPPFNGSAAILADESNTLILVLLNGAQIPANDIKPAGFKMPAFDDKLNNAQIADVLTYISNAWGNRTGAVSASQVAEKRQVMSSAP